MECGVTDVPSAAIVFQKSAASYQKANSPNLNHVLQLFCLLILFLKYIGNKYNEILYSYYCKLFIIVI